MKTTEKMIQEKNLTAPRVTNELIKSKIEETEIVEHIMKNGKVLRWACILMKNGFVITGKPSASASVENDDKEIGEKIAFDNAYNEIWAYEGYVLSEKLKDDNE